MIEMPNNDQLTLIEASRCAQYTDVMTVALASINYFCRICNRDIVARVQQVICFAFHDSNLLLETCREAKESRKLVTLFYLD